MLVIVRSIAKATAPYRKGRYTEDMGGMIALFISMRRDGMSLAEIIRLEMGLNAGAAIAGSERTGDPDTLWDTKPVRRAVDEMT